MSIIILNKKPCDNFWIVEAILSFDSSCFDWTDLIKGEIYLIEKNILLKFHLNFTFWLYTILQTKLYPNNKQLFYVLPEAYTSICEINN